MLEVRPGPDPYVFYKMHHMDRVRSAWALSEEIGLFEVLRDGPRTVSEVAKSLELTDRSTASLLSANGCLGILGNDEGRWFIHPIMREFVLEDGRARTTPHQDRDEYWYRVTKQAVLTGVPVPEEMPPWLTDPDGHEEESVAFSPGRHGWRILWGEALAEAFDFTPYRLVVDLGGATGGVLVGLTGKVPGLKGILMELPFSRAGAEAAIEKSGGADRVSFFSGNFFEGPYPEGADVIFMSHVIHDWNDAECLTLLGHCFEALPAGSPVIIQEYLLDDDKTGQLLGVGQWLGLLHSTSGDQRTAGEIGALLEQAGFADVESRPIDNEQTIVVGYKK